MTIIWPERDVRSALRDHGEVGMEERAEYAIAGSYAEFMNWRNEDREARRRVIFVNTTERAELLARWAPKGMLHRIGTWETSPARDAAEELERE